jgi:hypothetical protein
MLKGQTSARAEQTGSHWKEMRSIE